MALEMGRGERGVYCALITHVQPTLLKRIVLLARALSASLEEEEEERSRIKKGQVVFPA
jgi:hypothetical protein